MSEPKQNPAGGNARIALDKLCLLTGVDATRINRLARLGYFPKIKNGEYELAPTLKGLFRHFLEEEEKRKRPSDVQQLPVYSSMVACEAATGIPLFLIKQAKNEGCPAFRFSRVELEALLRFLFRDRKDAEAGSAKTGLSYRQEWEKYKAWREKIKWEIDTKSVVSKDEVRRDTVAATSELYQTLDRIFCNELPPTLIGLDEMQIRNRVKKEIDQMKLQLRQRFAEMTDVQPVEEADDGSVVQSFASSFDSESDSSESEPFDGSEEKEAA